MARVNVSAKQKQIITLHDIVAEVMEEAKGDTNAATLALMTKARTNPELYRELTEDYLLQACHAVIRLYVTQHLRPRAWEGGAEIAPAATGVHKQSDQRGGRLLALARVHAAGLLSFHLPINNQPMLKDATREKVREAAEYYLRLAADFAPKGKFLSLVADKLPEGKTVAEVFSEKQLQALQKKALGK